MGSASHRTEEISLAIEQIDGVGDAVHSLADWAYLALAVIETATGACSWTSTRTSLDALLRYSSDRSLATR